MTEGLRLRNSSEETIRSYIASIERLPDIRPEPWTVERRAGAVYRLHVLEERKLRWSAIHVNRAALRFVGEDGALENRDAQTH